MIKELNSIDLTFLFGSRMPEITKKIEQIKKEEGKELVDIDILNRLSNGRGVEAYNKLSQFRLQSKEYYSAFDFTNKKKTLDIKTQEGLNMHVYRNKNQYGKAPKDLATMYKFVKHGYFIEEGYSACHNILKNNNTPEARKKSLQIMIYYVRHIKESATEEERKAFLKKYTPYGNISFRGTPGTSFEGCQFIYNDKTGKLVVDNVNRGTWDFGKYGTTAHFLYDISPWLEMGNGDNVETADLFIMNAEQEKKYLATALDASIKKNLASAKDDMNSAVKNLIEFIGETIKTGGGKSLEDLQPIVSGDEYLAEQKALVEETRQNYINNFINNNSEKLQKEHDIAYDSLTKVLEFISSDDFRKDVAPFVDSISADTVEFENNKEEFVKRVMYASINAGDVTERGSNAEIDVPLNISVKVNVHEGFKRNLLQLLECNEAGAIEEFNRIKDFITTTLNNKLSEFNKDSNNKFELRILTDNVDNTFDVIEYSIEFTHILSKNEDIVCSKKTFGRSLSDEEKTKMNLPVIEEEATENLNVYHKPEWMSEEFFFNKKKQQSDEESIDKIKNTPNYNPGMKNKLFSEFKRAWNYQAFKYPSNNENKIVENKHKSPIVREYLRGNEYFLEIICGFQLMKMSEWDDFGTGDNVSCAKIFADVKNRWETRLKEKAQKIKEEYFKNTNIKFDKLCIDCYDSDTMDEFDSDFDPDKDDIFTLYVNMAIPLSYFYQIDRKKEYETAKKLLIPFCKKLEIKGYTCCLGNDDQSEEFLNNEINYFNIMDRDAWEGTDGHARDEDKYFEFERKWVLIEKKIKEFIKSYKDKNILHGTADDGGDWDDGTLDYEIPVYDKEDD